MLTGNTRYRRGLFNKMILEVEDARVYTCPHTFTEEPYTRWRDGTLIDVQTLLERPK